MYIKLRRQDVQCYRGTTYDDSRALQNENEEPASLSSGDKIIYGIKPHYSDECILERVLTSRDEINGEYPIHFTPEEMDIEPDEYEYDVSVQTADGDFIKIIPPSTFEILKSVTKKKG